jgi:hypothetical protein
MNPFKGCNQALSCIECGTHYDAPKEARWARWCPRCREPIMKQDLRIDAVLEWAKANWEKLEPEAAKWRTERANAYATAYNSHIPYTSPDMQQSLGPIAQILGFNQYKP